MLFNNLKKYLVSTFVFFGIAFFIITKLPQVMDIIAVYDRLILGCAIAILSISVTFQYRQNQFLRERDILYRQLKEKQAFIDRDLALARQVQQGMLLESIPKIPGLSLAASCIPASTIGGDFYGIKHIGHHVHLYIGDVTGHGISSALLMSLTNGLLQEIIDTTSAPDKILTTLNDRLCNLLHDNITFVTMAYLVIDLKKQTICFSSAGHPPAYLIDHNMPFTITTQNSMLGMFPENTYHATCTKLPKDATICLYTDGIVEARNAQGIAFGETNLIQLLKKKGPAQKIHRHIVETLTAYSPIPADDQTIIIVHT